MIKSSEIIDWCKKQLGCGYVYGMVDTICTVACLKLKEAQYGSSMGNGYYQLNGDYTKGRCAKWLGKLVYDCSGLIKSARMHLGGPFIDVSAQGTYLQCTQRGAITTMLLTPGCTVFMWSADKGRMGHVGIYIGGGKVIEARGVDYGVVTTNMKDRAWTHWGLLDWLEYDLPTETGKASTGMQNDAGDSSNPKPDDGLTFEQAIDILAKKTGISADYWKAKENIDPYFAGHEIKIAKAIQG